MKELMFKRKSTIIVSFIMIVLMAFAVMPAAVFAGTPVVDGNDVTIVSPGPVAVGMQKTLTADVTTSPAGAETHLEWSLAEGTNSDVATLNKRGVFTATSVGAVHAVVELRSGDFVQSQTPAGILLATDTMEIDVVSGIAYGFQGNNGNSMFMLNPSDITVISTNGVSDGFQVYRNEINTLVPIEETEAIISESALGITQQAVTGCLFTYTMSAGLNNFQIEQYFSYMDDIVLLDSNGTQVSDSEVFLVSPTVNGPTTSLMVVATGVQAGQKYTLQFGSEVAGNNPGKNLGADVQFDFTAAASSR